MPLAKLNFIHYQVMRTAFIILTASLALTFSATSCKDDTPWKSENEESEIVSGGGENNQTGNTEEDANSGVDHPQGGETGDNQNNGGLEGPVSIGDETVYTGVAEWTGPKADDASSDVAGSDSDIYWEACSWNDIVTVVYDGSTATVTSNNDKIITNVAGAHVTIDLETNSRSIVT